MNAPVRDVHITRKEREYQGMMEYREGDESRLLKNLVVGMSNLFYQANNWNEIFLNCLNF